MAVLRSVFVSLFIIILFIYSTAAEYFEDDAYEERSSNAPATFIQILKWTWITTKRRSSQEETSGLGS